MNNITLSRIRTGFGAAFLLTLSGCVQPARYGAARNPPPPDYAEAGVVGQDDFFYYPAHQIYYNSYRREYIYQDGGAWVTRPTPRVSVEVLFASPTVRLDFHDAPAFHHIAVRQQYPEHWAPPEANPPRRTARPDNGNRRYQGGHR